MGISIDYYTNYEVKEMIEKYNKFIEEYKETIDNLIKLGYKFCIELDEQFDYQEKSKIWLELFTYIIVTDDLIYDIDNDKIIIKE